MNKVTVSPINSIATVPLQCRLSLFSEKCVKCKKKKKKCENADTAMQINSARIYCSLTKVNKCGYPKKKGLKCIVNKHRRRQLNPNSHLYRLIRRIRRLRFTFMFVVGTHAHAEAENRQG